MAAPHAAAAAASSRWPTALSARALALALLVLSAGVAPVNSFLGSNEGDPSEAAREASDVGAGSLPSFDLVVVVPSHADGEAPVRSAIRHSWAQYLNKSAVNCSTCESHAVKILFVVGKEGNHSNIDSEVKEFNDVGVLEDFRQPEAGGDAEMTQRAIRYSLEHFRFKLLLKADTRSWVFMDRLLDFLETEHLFEINASMPGVYAGNFNGPKSPALLGAASLDEVFYKQTGSSVYPKHAQGAGFLLSPDLCEFISGMGAPSEDTSGAPKWGAEYGWAPVPRLASLLNEEVSVGFWLLPVNHTKHYMPVAIGKEACLSDHQSLVLDHGMDVESLKQRWRNYIKTGDVCRAEQAHAATPSFLRRGLVKGGVTS